MKEKLEELGFTPYEAAIYLCLLENGQLSAYSVAEKIGLYRQACYDALNRMMERGVVTSLQEGRKQLFRAASPTVLQEKIREKELLLQEMMPKMLQMIERGEDPVSVEVFKGKSALRLSLQDIVRVLKEQGGHNYCTAVDELLLLDRDPIVIEQYKREMLQNNMKEKVIIRKGMRGLFPPQMSEYRHVPDRYFNPYPVQIYGHTVQILLTGSPHHLIIIRNQSIADSFRKQFELMWSVAKPLKERT